MDVIGFMRLFIFFICLFSSMLSVSASVVETRMEGSSLTQLNKSLIFSQSLVLLNDREFCHTEKRSRSKNNCACNKGCDCACKCGCDLYHNHYSSSLLKKSFWFHSVRYCFVNHLPTQIDFSFLQYYSPPDSPPPKI